MSGHSKWSTIKHKKAKTDSARAVVFQKYPRELINGLTEKLTIQRSLGINEII